MNVTIIGSGNMAKGIATRFVDGGHTVTVHAQDEEKAKEIEGTRVVAVGGETDEIVVLATPYTEVENIAKSYDGFAGKIIIDISNPVDFNTFELLPKPGESGAQHVADVLSDAKVVKAFNTTLAGALVAGEVEGKQLDVFVAGDDDEAKSVVKELVNSSNLRAVDVGPLSESRHLEGFGLIQMKIQDQIGTNWMSALKFLG